MRSAGATAAEGIYAVSSVSDTDADSDVRARDLQGVALIIDRTLPALFNAVVTPPLSSVFADVEGANALHAANESIATASIDVAGTTAACVVDGAAITCDAVIVASTDGPAAVAITAIDVAGNLSRAQLPDVVIDTEPPAIVVDSVSIRTLLHGSRPKQRAAAGPGRRASRRIELDCTRLTLTRLKRPELCLVFDEVWENSPEFLGDPVVLFWARQEGRTSRAATRFRFRRVAPPLRGLSAHFTTTRVRTHWWHGACSMAATTPAHSRTGRET